SLNSVFASTPIEALVPVEHIYIPRGFDSNDRAEVIIAGNLPNLCHKSPMAKVRLEGNVIYVELSSLYYEPNNPFCAEMVVPFLETVSLGVLKAGDYEIVVNRGHFTEQKAGLIITSAGSPDVDDYV